MLAALLLGMCLVCDPFRGLGQVPVDVELVLAVDASTSIDSDEAVLQREGYVAALRHPDFIRAVRAGRYGRIAITYFEWAGTVRVASTVPWTVIDGETSANAFAREVLTRPRYGSGGTSISRAIWHGSMLFLNVFEGDRLVIDVSGDGPNNIGTPVKEARDRAVADGVVVNGLPIMLKSSWRGPPIDLYYADCVIGGPGSFSLPIRDESEFETAIRRKLILEVSGAMPPAEIVPAAAEPVDCEYAERDRRLLADPYFPQLDK
jgi:hypothetical protein